MDVLCRGVLVQMAHDVQGLKTEGHQVAQDVPTNDGLVGLGVHVEDQKAGCRAVHQVGGDEVGGMTLDVEVEERVGVMEVPWQHQ